MTNWPNYGKWRHGKKRKELLENNIFTYPEDVPAEIINPIMEGVARQVENWENINKMNKEEAKDQLIQLLMGQVIDLSMMSKIELGDDVIAEINRLKKIINDNQ
jgi:hypothetical protein